MSSPTASHPRVGRIAVVGLGNVGRLIADMLIERGFDVQGVDADERRAAGERAAVLDVSDPAALRQLFGGVDAVMSCLPYYLNAVVARAAHSAGVHYVDLTEDVATSRTVRQLAQSSDTIFMPRCGLAPGFVCVVGAGVAARMDTVDRIELRAGALPRSPNNTLGYACNWSPAGIVNEYLNDCEQLRGGEPVSVPPLSELETIVIDGARYEAFTTSGGLGTMSETFAGRVDRLDYKSIRYPGHCKLMLFMLEELGLGRQREKAVRLLANAYPPVRDDVVIVYAVAVGDRGGAPRPRGVRAPIPSTDRRRRRPDRDRMDDRRRGGEHGRVARRGFAAGLGLRLPGGRAARRFPSHVGRSDACTRAFGRSARRQLGVAGRLKARDVPARRNV
jgi:saccharopine dehydrogenase-like NADP-dependent oxidoreductase